MNKKIKLSLLGTLIAGSALAITLPMVSCSGSTEEVKVVELTVTDAVLKDATDAITNDLHDKMQVTSKTWEDQKEFADKWPVKGEVQGDGQLELIQNALKFTDADGKEVDGKTAVLKATYESETIVPETEGENITSPIIHIHLKDGYTVKGEVKIEIQVGSLGTSLAKAPTPIFTK
ncbi:MAG: hypothetical protein ACRCUM_01810 [Mycoplasmoidaceae bacterium]